MGKKFLWIVSLAFLLIAISSENVLAGYSDVSGHWAAVEINDFVNQNLAKGYPDGTFKPDNEITRAEFITLVNRVFEYNRSSAIAFADCTPKDWFYVEVAKAKTAGYISGYADNTIKPNKEITREEVAAIIDRILKLATLTNQSTVYRLRDANNISDWSQEAIGAVLTNKFMNGYPDQTFRPQAPITRAEAVVTLYRAERFSLQGATFNRAGVYGSNNIQTFEGDVTVSAADVTLQNMIINGNLNLTKEIEDGNVDLKNVTVKGTTNVKGGGMHSIILNNSHLGKVTVDKEDGQVRLVASGTSVVGEVTLKSGAKLEESSLTGTGFGSILADTTLPATEPITLAGNFDQAKINRRVNVEVESGRIRDFTVASTASGTNINLQDSAAITNLTLNAAVNVTGAGQIATAQVNVSGTTMEKTPANLKKAAGVILGNYVEPEISADIPTAVIVTQERNFTLSIDANSALNTLAKWRMTIKNNNGDHPVVSDLNAGTSIQSVTFNSQGVALYPTNGIGVVDSERRFKIRFNSAGTYNYKFELIKVSDNHVLAEVEGTISATSNLVYGYQLAIAELFVDDTKTALVSGVTQEDLDFFKELLEEDLLDTEPEKAELLEDLQKAQELLDLRNQTAAPAAVEDAEDAIVNLDSVAEIRAAQQAYDQAYELVSDLPDDTGTSTFKADLLSDLVAVKEAINDAIDQLVAELETDSAHLTTLEELNAAQLAYNDANNLVNDLLDDTADSAFKAGLDNRLAVVQQRIDEAAAIQEATQAVVDAESALNDLSTPELTAAAQAAYEAALTQVNALPESSEIKAELINRLADVQAGLPAPIEATLPEVKSTADIEAAILEATSGHNEITISFGQIFTPTDDNGLTFDVEPLDADIANGEMNSAETGLVITQRAVGIAHFRVTATTLSEESVDAEFSVVVENQAPTWNAISEKEGYVGGPTITVENLNEYCSDGDGDRLIFTAKSNASDVAEVTVDNTTGKLTIIPQKEGIAIVEVTAEDAYQGENFTAFQITVVDEPAKVKDFENQLINEVKQINLTDYFADEDPLEFTVFSSDPSIATVSNSVYNWQLEITPVSTGTSEITVTADDGDGGTLALNFNVTVTLDPATESNSLAGTNDAVNTNNLADNAAGLKDGIDTSGTTEALVPPESNPDSGGTASSGSSS